jgi:hypothetical protein
LSATNFEGASTAATGATSSVGVASSVGSVVASAVGSALAGGVGIAPSSLFDADCDQTIIANRTIPTTTAPRTVLEVPCLGATDGLGVEVDFAATGVVVTFTREDVLIPPRGTGGTTNADAELFFATFLVVLFALFFTADFFATLFLATAFLATRFLAVDFLATDFFATAFFFAGAFLEAFFTTLFVVDFFTATFTP